MKVYLIKDDRKYKNRPINFTRCAGNIDGMTFFLAFYRKKDAQTYIKKYWKEFKDLKIVAFKDLGG